MTELIAWRTTDRMLRSTRKRLKYYFIEEWVRFFYLLFPLVALPTTWHLWRSKAIMPWELHALLTPMCITAVVAVFFALRNVLSASRFIKSDYELSGSWLRVRNRARTQMVSWENVRKWTLEPHPYAAGMQMLRFNLIKPTERYRSRHIDMEIDPHTVELPQVEAFILNRVGFGAAGYVPVYEPLG